MLFLSCRKKFLLVRVSAVTKRWRGGALALAQCYLFRFADLECNRFETAAFMRPITKRLITRLAATAPIISACFQGLNEGFLGCYFCFCHDHCLQWIKGVQAGIKPANFSAVNTAILL